MIEITLKDGKRVEALVGGHVIRTDQSIKSGGDNSAPEPFNLFLASIGTCAGIYVKNFCDERNIPTDNIKITQNQDYNMEKRLIDNISIFIELPDDFPEKYKEPLLRTVNLCTVKRHLSNPPNVRTRIKKK